MSSDSGYSTRTFGNELHLPRVPLPDLESTCDRFLDWCAPLLTEEQLADTKTAVAEFLAPGGPARTLHAELERYNADPDVHSWLDTFWPYRYLGRRDRIALNANFFFLFRESVLPAVEPGQDPQIVRAARLVTDTVTLKLALDDERVAPVFLRGQPQTMVQYRYLFSTTRIPGAEVDSVRAPYSDEWPGPSRARHIVVLAAGRMTRLDVLDADGRRYPEDTIAGALAEIRAAARESAAGGSEDSVGHLTTMARADWARRRAELRALDPANADALETIESALFFVCLDAVAPADDLGACDQLLYGSADNRWFDKALSLVVLADGRAGVNIEHCELDGTTILAYLDTILAPRAELPDVVTADGAPAYGPVEFVLDDELRGAIRAAAASFTAFGEDTASTVLSFSDFGSEVAKKLGSSPDAFVQMAYQLAHVRAKGRLGATYESIATRQWRYGRTEAMRVVTPEVVAFVEAMQSTGDDADTRRQAFRTAAAAHVARAKECQQGHAPEQHLWELQLIQRRKGAELGVTAPLALYDSPGWTIMRDDYLSTSSAPSTNVEYFGFGSTASQCIGVAYVLLPDRLNIYLSTPRPVEAEMAVFARELRRAIDELVGLLSEG